MGCANSIETKNASPVGKQLPAASAEDIERLLEKGVLLSVAGPAVDVKGKNNLQTVYFAEYENGTELTLLFLDEDRPSKMEDKVYDTIRRPLFGRFSDIETIFIMKDTVEFPGTYSADQKWDCGNPHHNKATISLDKFERHENGNELLLWVNTWNHLMGEVNNNPDMKLIYSMPLPSGQEESDESTDYVVRMGTRAQVDAMFSGLIKSVSKVMTDERAACLGSQCGYNVQTDKVQLDNVSEELST